MMFCKTSPSLIRKSTVSDSNDDEINDYLIQSTSHLLPPDAAIQSSSITREDRSSPIPIGSSNTTSHIRSSLTSFLKISSPNRRLADSSPNDDRFVMTIIRSPSTGSQRPLPTNEPIVSSIANEDLSNSNKFFKSKMTAALNHMKYRSYLVSIVFCLCVHCSTRYLSFRLGNQNTIELSYK
jgi:hypothetical protein